MIKIVISTHFFLFFFLINLNAQEKKATIYILGVTHSAQLISETQQPAAIRTFIKNLNPKAIGIERSPDEFSKNDFYEFTYEQQYCIIPYAKEKMIPLYPIDWLPSPSDVNSAFGVDNLEIPNFTRNKSGFWGFTFFEDSTDFTAPLYYAENADTNSQKWYETYPEKQINTDFARRLFLYRTFLHTKRIIQMAKRYPNDTVLVVIGSLHKADIEKHLLNEGYNVGNPASIKIATENDINQNFSLQDAYAILSFQLLGVQLNTGKLNIALLKQSINYINKNETNETKFFNIKYAQEIQKGSKQQAVINYQKLLSNLTGQDKFSFTGVKYNFRIDSYFDPFGNMSILQRTQLEVMKLYKNLKDYENYQSCKNLLLKQFTGFKKSMLDAYVAEYVEAIR